MSSNDEMHDFSTPHPAGCYPDDDFVATLTLTATAPLRYVWYRYVRGLSAADADRAIIATTRARVRRT